MSHIHVGRNPSCYFGQWWYRSACAAVKNARIHLSFLERNPTILRQTLRALNWLHDVKADLSLCWPHYAKQFLTDGSLCIKWAITLQYLQKVCIKPRFQSACTSVQSNQCSCFIIWSYHFTNDFQRVDWQAKDWHLQLDKSTVKTWFSELQWNLQKWTSQ